MILVTTEFSQEVIKNWSNYFNTKVKYKRDMYPEMMLHAANLNGHPLKGNLISKTSKLAVINFKEYNYTIEIPLKYVILN